jgi:SAM-dependent methyltransferase
MSLALAAADRAILQELHELEPGLRPRQFGNLMTASQYLPVYQLTRRHIEPGQSALDWGSGNGHFSYFLLRSGLEVDAFNLAAQANQLALKLKLDYPRHYRLTIGPDHEPTALPYASGQFDRAFSIGVLEHVRETGGSEAASLAELHRVLKPGGRLICGMLPKRYSWIEFLVRHGADPAKHRHAFRYTAAELRGLLQAAGFRLLELTSHGMLPRNSLCHPRLAPVHNRPMATAALNALDRALAVIGAPIAQNFLLAAEKIG